MPRRWSAPLALAGLLGAACGDGPAAGRGAFEPAACWFDAPAAHVVATCGTVTVPEDRALPAGRTHRLYVAIFSARDPRARRHADPVVYLDGGPGGPGVADVVRLFPSFVGFVDGGRDVVAIDQRGTGDARPSLVCPPGSARDECRAALAARTDLGQYSSAINAADLEDVRRALGYRPWNLLGVSYGTRLAQEALRLYPAGVRSAILDSVVPPDVNLFAEGGLSVARTLAELEAACTRHPACARAYPGFAQRALALASAAPLEADVAGARVEVPGPTVLAHLRALAYRAQALPDLPELVERLRERSPDAARALIERPIPTRAFSDGLYFTIACAEMAAAPMDPDTARARATLDPRLRAFSDHESFRDGLCPRWGARPPDPSTFHPVTSAIPTLLLSGRFDPVTPPAYGERVAAALAQRSHHVVEDGSHGNFFQPCATPAVAAFLAAPTAPVAWSCPAGPPTIEFNVPAHRASAPLGAVDRGLADRALFARLRAARQAGPTSPLP